MQTLVIAKNIVCVFTLLSIAVAGVSCAENPNPMHSMDEKKLVVEVKDAEGRPMINQKVALIIGPLTSQPGGDLLAREVDSIVREFEVWETDGDGYLELPRNNFDVAILDDGLPRFWHRYSRDSFVDRFQSFVFHSVQPVIQAFPKYDPSVDVKDAKRKTARYASRPFEPQEVMEALDFVAFSGPIPELTANGFTEWECIVRFVPINDIPAEAKTDQLMKSIESMEAYGVMQLWLRMPEGFHVSIFRGTGLLPGALKGDSISREVLVVETLVANLNGLGVSFPWFNIVVGSEDEGGGVAQCRISGWMRTWGEEDEEQWRINMIMDGIRFNNKGPSLIPKKPAGPVYEERELILD